MRLHATEDENGLAHEGNVPTEAQSVGARHPGEDYSQKNRPYANAHPEGGK